MTLVLHLQGTADQIFGLDARNRAIDSSLIGFVQASLGELCRRARVHDLTFHDLRHRAATWLLEAGVFRRNPETLRHRLHGMGEGYIHNGEARLRDAVTRLEVFLLAKFREREGKVQKRQ